MRARLRRPSSRKRPGWPRCPRPGSPASDVAVRGAQIQSTDGSRPMASTAPDRRHCTERLAGSPTCRRDALVPGIGAVRCYVRFRATALIDEGERVGAENAILFDVDRARTPAPRLALPGSTGRAATSPLGEGSGSGHGPVYTWLDWAHDHMGGSADRNGRRAVEADHRGRGNYTARRPFGDLRLGRCATGGRRPAVAGADVARRFAAACGPS